MEQRHPRKCTGTARSGNPCTRWAIKGGTVCPNHGGGAPQVKEAALRRVAAQVIAAKASREIAHEGIHAVEDPLAELGKLASGAQAMMLALGAQVNALTDVEHFDAKNTPHVRVAVELYERAMDRSHKFLDSLVRHGYMERQVRLAETEALLVSGVIRRVIQGMGLTKEQQLEASRLMAEEFRRLEKNGMKEKTQ